MGTAEAAAMGQEAEGQGRSTGAKVLAAHGDAIARVCMALLGDAREVERVLEQIARAAGSKKPADGMSERAWIFGIARAECANQLSKVPLRAVTHATGPITERLGASAAMPARTALSKLKPTEREAVVLHTVAELDIEDVAHACNVDVETARNRISQGMQKLMEGGV